MLPGTAYHHGWQVADKDMAGRVYPADNGLPDVVIDGRRVSWEQLGQMVASFDGWWFRLAFGDDYLPQPSSPPLLAGTDATVIPLRPRRRKNDDGVRGEPDR